MNLGLDTACAVAGKCISLVGIMLTGCSVFLLWKFLNVERQKKKKKTTSITELNSTTITTILSLKSA